MASQGHGGQLFTESGGLGGCAGCLQTGMFTHTDAGEDSGWSLEGKSSGEGGQTDRCSYELVRTRLRLQLGGKRVY